MMTTSMTARRTKRAVSPPSDPVAVDAQLRTFKDKRVAVAMSGGVDSAVAALRLKEAGAHPIGLSLRLHDPDPDHPLASRACCPPDDLQDARRVAEVLEIPFYVIDAREAFDAHVVEPFVSAYLGGRTPNPCVECNTFVKLGGLARRARVLGCEALATGHYARRATDDLGRPHLYTGVDARKDQSYFLFGTPPDVLADLIFPVGAMTKDEVREAAIAACLPVAHKLDSQEVCFVGGKGATDYVKRRAAASGDRSGAIVDGEGSVLGRHDGVFSFTIGQHRGLGLGTHEKLYVVDLDAETRTVRVGQKEALLRRGLFGSRASWPAGVPEGAVRALARIRYRSPGVSATIEPLADQSVRVMFDEPVPAVAPGQAVVFYDGEEVLGGAWIAKAIA
jgi:tRNA-specific 2-thiouridylase